MINFYLEYEFWFAATQLVFAMFGIGATLTLADFKAVVSVPKPFIIGLSIQIVLVPLAAYLFIQGLMLESGLAAGLAICVAIPGGSMSNVFTLMARGHVPLSIAISGVTSLICLVTTPVILMLLASEYFPENFSMPVGKIFFGITLYLLVPLSLGMVVLAYFPKIANKVSVVCVRISMLVIVFMCVGAMSAGRIDFVALGIERLMTIIVFMCLLVAVSYVIPRLFKLNGSAVSAINLEITVRNIGLGILIKASLFPVEAGVVDPIGDMALVTLLVYGGASFFAGVGIVATAKHNVLNFYPNKTEVLST